MLIAMAGLPAAGKSTLAARLRDELGGVVLDKDAVRAALFPPPVLDYSEGQNDVCMAAIYSAAARILKSNPQQAVIIDGRTFQRSYQVRDLLALAASVGQTAHFIECACADEIARARLVEDMKRGRHPAGNRTFALYLALKTKAEPIAAPHLTLDTGATPLEEYIRRCLDFLRQARG